MLHIANFFFPNPSRQQLGNFNWSLFLNFRFFLLVFRQTAACDWSVFTRDAFDVYFVTLNSIAHSFLKNTLKRSHVPLLIFQKAMFDCCSCSLNLRLLFLVFTSFHCVVTVLVLSFLKQQNVRMAVIVQKRGYQNLWCSSSLAFIRTWIPKRVLKSEEIWKQYMSLCFYVREKRSWFNQVQRLVLTAY